MTFKDVGVKFFAAVCYMFGVPLLYIILSDLRKVKFLAINAACAFFVWIFEIIAMLGVRAIIYWLNNSYGMPFFEDYLFGVFWAFMGINGLLGVLVVLGIKFRLPIISFLAERMA